MRLKLRLYLLLMVQIGGMILFPTTGFADQCEEENFLPRWSQTLLGRAEQLDPEVAARLRTRIVEGSEPLLQMQSAMTTLKEVEFEYSDDYTMRWPTKRQLSQAQIDHIRLHFSDAYDLGRLNPEELKQFYANQIRQFYLWLSPILVEAIVEERLKIIDKSLGQVPTQLRPLLFAIVEIKMGRGWNSRSESPNDLSTIFTMRPWEALNWEELITRLKNPEVSSTTPDFHIDQLIEQAKFHVERREPICCQTPPGCRTCPINSRHQR